jgi:hypothetical protein
MASGDRFYQLSLRHRPAVWGDIGNLLKIEGLVIGGEGAQAVLLLPSFEFGQKLSQNVFQLSAEEWSVWLQQSDNPEFFDSFTKAFHRKVRYEISGAVQQKVWKADGLKCMYCDAIMGDVQLTIDHFTPLETGGKNDQSNYLTACRRCNKNKGAQDPREFCKNTRHDYDFYVQYLADRIIK